MNQEETSMTKVSRRLQTAIHAVKQKSIGLRAASGHYHVPYSTLRDNTKRDAVIGRKPRCLPPCLTAEDERLIEDTVLECADHGFPPRKADILDIINLFAARLPAS